ncbi:MAG: hypothetical protein EZS28_029566 [Streblomastix strix]|uniref:DUF4817 domain-containing protein n=1 Tax=Streblomastix strix TaxID=222440 RepID=A0A5J4UX71_9EUKA|nr:MAG: hypothetical protein EZS28_029566 [Streblomastix strix]
MWARSNQYLKVKKPKSVGRSIKQRINAVKQFYILGSVQKVLKNWIQKPKPDRQFITRTVKKFELTGSVHDKEHKGRKKTITTEENVAKVKEILQEKPTSPIRTAVEQVGLTLGNTERIKLSLGLHSYRLQRRQELLETDYQTRMEAYMALLEKQKKSPNFCDKIFWSDECLFELAGHINTFNCYYNAAQNPHFTMEVTNKASKKP